MNRKEIDIRDIRGIKIGQAEDVRAGTGCTVLLAEQGMAAGLDVRGGGPASRESQLMNPLAAAQTIHGIVLAGGSAFGLGAADGVMQYLEERDMGYEACANAQKGNSRDGNYGAGCGATVGKIASMDFCMKSGIGSYAIQLGGLQVGALAAVNALGDIYDWKTGCKVAGLLAEDKKSFRRTEDVMYASTEVVENKFTGNTTIGIIVTNGCFEKTALCKIAGMAHDGYARSIRPVHTGAERQYL